MLEQTERFPEKEISLEFQLFPHSDIPLHRQEQNRPFLFTPVEIKVKHGTVIQIGRKIDRSKDRVTRVGREDRAANNVSLDINHMSTETENPSGECIAFRSKVVSRHHAEIWVGKDSQMFFRDVGSSSGSFLNRLRLSPSGKESRPYPISSGDIIQLGVDYQGRQDEIYKAVMIKVFINAKKNVPVLANRNRLNKAIKALVHAMNPNSVKEDDELTTECCICINAMAPYQALFLAPCSHCFHYKCVTTLLGAGFMFQCPLCRQVANLEASVAEPDDLSVEEEDENYEMDVDEVESKTLSRKINPHPVSHEIPVLPGNEIGSSNVLIENEEVDIDGGDGVRGSHSPISRQLPPRRLALRTQILNAVGSDARVETSAMNIPVGNRLEEIQGADIPNTQFENTPRNYSILQREMTNVNQEADETQILSNPNPDLLEALSKITNALQTGDRANIDLYLSEYANQVKQVLESSVGSDNVDPALVRDILTRMTPSVQPGSDTNRIE